MCSDSSGGGDGGGDGGSENNSSESDMKKAQPRRQKIPKRGPGVAELEKILKEQEGRDSAMAEPDELSSSSSSFLFSLPNNTCYYNHHHSPSLNPNPNPPGPPPPPLPPPPTVNPSTGLIGPWTPLVSPLVRNLDHIPSAPSPRNAVSTGTSGGGDGGSGVPSSEKALFPMTGMTFPPPFSHIQSSIPIWSCSSSSPPLRENDIEYFPSMVNYIPGSASTASPSSSAAASRLFHQIEHPSSQRSTNYNYISIVPEEEKMGNAKRLRPFSVESQTDSNLHRKAPIFPNMAIKESSSSSPSSSLELKHSGLFNLDLMGTNLRDAKRCFTSPLMGWTKSNTNKNNQAEGSSNFITLGSSMPIPSTHSFPHEFAAFDFLSSQEKMEDSPQKAGESGSDYNKKLSSVFESKEKMGSKETSIGSYKEMAEAEGEGNDIDLNLKL